MGEQNQSEAGMREQRAEVLLWFLRTAEKKEAIFSDEQHKRQFVENLTAEGFLQFLNGINGILRGKKKTDWQMDGETVAVVQMIFGVGFSNELIPPAYEDKPELLEKVLSTAKAMSRAGKSFEDIALVISAAINAVHPFNDGNGRTSRIVYQLLTKGFSEENKKELQAVLLEFGRDTVDINPGLIQVEINDLVKKEVDVDNPEKNPENMTNLFSQLNPREITFRQETDENIREIFLGLCRKEQRNLFLSVFLFFQNNPGLNRTDFIKEFPGRSVILIEKLAENLNQEQFSQILQNYRNLKKRYVEILIEALAEPENEKYQIEIDGQKISLKTLFENRMKENQAETAQKERERKETAESEAKKIAAIKEREESIKRHFEKGEGSYKIFEASEINSIRKIERRVAEISVINTTEFSAEQKINILKETLFSLAQKINPKVSISHEMINTFVEKRKDKISESVVHFQKVLEIMNYLENSDFFISKINTSTNNEEVFFDQAELDNRKDLTRFFDDLFSQSIYYISPSGMSLRLKLFEIASGQMTKVIQPTAEQIFYNDEMIDYTDKKVIKISDLSPEPGKFVFEIISPEFRQAVLQAGSTQDSIKSGVGVISDQDEIYVNIPRGAILHSGWRVVNITQI
ncbi:MAG: Fic family protein [Candidatus Uhrbacteria bacterium]